MGGTKAQRHFLGTHTVGEADHKDRIMTCTVGSHNTIRLPPPPCESLVETTSSTRF